MTEVRHEKINFTPVLDPEFTVIILMIIFWLYIKWWFEEFDFSYKEQFIENINYI